MNKYNKGTIESAILAIAQEYPTGTIFDVRAFELWRDDCGLSVNDSWRIGRAFNSAQLAELSRGRWEVFRANYSPRGRVKDLQVCNEYGGEYPALIDCAGVPFLELRPIKLD